MEYKKTIYEVIEIYPNILRHKIPLMQILMGIFYYGTYPFILVYLLYKKGLSLFSNIELSRGAENNPLSCHFDLDTLDAVDLDKEDVLNTESIYYSFKDSIVIGEELNSKGYNLFENVGKKYRIKKRIETLFSNVEKDNEEQVIISVPLIAIRIHKIFDTLKLL